ncbi:MAG: amidotransferase [Bacteroidota bacterium]
MTAGLFICDHVPSEYQSTFGDYSDMFARLFPEFEWKLYDIINGRFPRDLNECDVYMATGSHHSVYENLAWINKTKEMIRELYSLNKFFIGFCFGHQLLGDAMGGKVEKSSNGWCVGAHVYTVSEQTDWMVPYRNPVNLLMVCQDQVVKLPEHARVLASAEMCPNAIIQVGQRMLGIQGHPEFSKEYDQFLMEKRVERIGAEVVKEGIKSLEKKIDTDLIHDWILAFLQRAV